MAIGVAAPATDPYEPIRRTPLSLEFRILGPLEVRRDGAPIDLGGPRQRALLAILLLSAGRVIAADALVDRLWGEAPPPSAAGSLHAYISNLRRALEPDRAPREASRVLVSVRPGYTLNVPQGSVDADVFVGLATDGQRALADGDATAAADCLARALDLWRGPALADLRDAPFATIEATRLEEARLQALEDRAEAELLLGRHGGLVAELQALVEVHPLRERLRGQLMLALYRSGRQSEALDVARTGRERLAEELGLDPDPAIRALEERILRQDPTLVRASVEAPPMLRSAVPEAGMGIVERRGEIAVLDRALAAAVSGHGRVVLVGGEPGIGKTHLVETFSAGSDGTVVGWGRSHDGAGTPPFWPWRQVLRELTSDLDDAALRTVVGGDAAIVADVVPELAGRLERGTGPSPDAPTARFRFFDASTRILLELGRRRPVLVALDDIQWADVPSIELLRYLAAEIRASHVLVVATYRDVGWEPGDAVAAALADLARQQHVERLLLDGLTAAGVRELMSAFLPGDPTPELVEAALARTDGNPLFVTHLARFVQAVDGPAPAEVIHDGVPPAVADLIGFRVAVLPEGTRRLLAVASTIGREFDLGLLVQTLDTRSDGALALIDPALRAGLVCEADVPGRFRFTHALIRDVIAEDAGPARSAHIHGQVGDALASSRTDDRDVAAVAEHYWRAAHVGWADEALDYALLAADRATTALAHEEEERQLDRALEIVTGGSAIFDRDTRELQVQLRRARLLMRTQGYGVPAVGEAAARARELAADLSAESEHLLASWGLAAHRIVRSEHGAAHAIALEMIERAEITGNLVLALAGHQTAGVPLAYMGRSVEALPHLQRSRAIAAELPPEVLARFPQNVEIGDLVYLGFAHWLVGEAELAERCCAAGLELAGTIGGYDEAFMLQGAAYVAAFARDHALTRERTERALAICEEIGYRHIAAGVAILHGWAASHLDDPDAGISEIQRSIAYHEEVGQNVTHVSYNQTLLADALLRAGRVAEAREAIGTATLALDASDEVFYGPETWRVRGGVLAADPAAARSEIAASLRAAVELAESQSCPPFRDRAAAQLDAHLAGRDVHPPVE